VLATAAGAAAKLLLVGPRLMSVMVCRQRWLRRSQTCTLKNRKLLAQHGGHRHAQQFTLHLQSKDRQKEGCRRPKSTKPNMHSHLIHLFTSRQTFGKGTIKADGCREMGHTLMFLLASALIT
jgi:hypothetical protein